MARGRGFRATWWHGSDFPAGEHFDDDDLHNDKSVVATQRQSKESSLAVVGATPAAAWWLDYEGGAPGHSDLLTDELGGRRRVVSGEGAFPRSSFFFLCFFLPLPSLAAIRAPTSLQELLLL